MNILFVSRCLPQPLTSGDRVLLHHLTRELAARGHCLDLLGFFLGGESAGMEWHGGAFSHVEPIRERPRAPLDYLIRLAHFFPKSSRQCWNPRMWEAIQDRLTRRNYDVVHFFGGVQVYEFRNLVVGSLPSIIVPYESYSLYLQRARALAQRPPDRLKLWAMSIMARRYESVMYGGFGRVVTVTEGDSACLRSLAPDLSTTVIPNGVDGSFFRQVGASDRPPSLVFVGNMSYPPNVLAALALIREILPRVKSEVTDARAIIVGPQPPAELTCLRGPDVEISGWVADIRPYLERSGCFVSPLTGGTGMRNKILEAMAMGLPVVATPMSCEGIKVTHGEDILLGRTPEELARAAICLLRDPSLSVRIAEGGQRLMREHHTWASVADQYEVLYDEVRSEWRLGRVGRGAVGRTRDVEDPGDHPRLQ